VWKAYFGDEVDRLRIHVHAKRPLTTNWLASVLKYLSIELDSLEILRCHSFRCGFACALLLAGIPLAENIAMSTRPS
jgi:hypothetical protein